MARREPIDMTGQRFGRWVVVSLASLKPYTRWLCRCDCGTESNVLRGALVNGMSRSCGCLKRELLAKLDRKSFRRGESTPEQRAKRRQYRETHAARHPEWVAARRLRENERKAAVRLAEDPAVRKARRDADYRKNIDKRRAQGIVAVQKRRALKRGNGGAGVSTSDWLASVESFGGLCAYCLVANAETMDHVMPLCKGGQHDPSNILPACRSCNYRKGRNSLVEFVGRLNG